MISALAPLPPPCWKLEPGNASPSPRPRSSQRARSLQRQRRLARGRALSAPDRRAGGPGCGTLRSREAAPTWLAPRGVRLRHRPYPRLRSPLALQAQREAGTERRTPGPPCPGVPRPAAAAGRPCAAGWQLPRVCKPGHLGHSGCCCFYYGCCPLGVLPLGTREPRHGAAWIRLISTWPRRRGFGPLPPVGSADGATVAGDRRPSSTASW